VRHLVPRALVIRHAVMEHVAHAHELAPPVEANVLGGFAVVGVRAEVRQVRVPMPGHVQVRHVQVWQVEVWSMIEVEPVRKAVQCIRNGTVT